MRRRNLAAEYEKRYPDTGCSEAQKTERMERILFKQDRSSHSRTGRNRGIIITRDLPWAGRRKAAA